MSAVLANLPRLCGEGWIAMQQTALEPLLATGDDTRCSTELSEAERDDSVALGTG